MSRLRPFSLFASYRVWDSVLAFGFRYVPDSILSLDFPVGAWVDVSILSIPHSDAWVPPSGSTCPLDGTYPLDQASVHTGDAQP